MFYDDQRLAGKVVRVEVRLGMLMGYLVHALDVDLARNRSLRSRSLIVNLHRSHRALLTRKARSRDIPDSMIWYEKPLFDPEKHKISILRPGFSLTPIGLRISQE